ncbi:hypothetical protein KY333_01115 [Candidatus Woesearchaeota archaeon]|nr:hypothetical protein [Candidatus Woesearchaeota archaeon]MBW2994330.1 hypothetical protein [Candidatus Woesearchaeota archaeon]
MAETKQDKDKKYRNLIERLIIFYELPVGLFKDRPLALNRAKEWVEMIDSGQYDPNSWRGGSLLKIAEWYASGF